MPVDPWGEPYRIITEAAFVRIQVNDPKARRLLVSSLTPEEVRALEAAAEPRLTDAERADLRAMVRDLADDDLETREGARKALSKWGAPALPGIRERLKTEKVPEARRWLEEAVESVPDLPPTWKSELANLAATVGSVEVPPGAPPGHNELNATASLKTLAAAQADFRANDRDGNRIQDFWTGDVAGLYCVTQGGAIKLIEISIAAADAAPLAAPAAGGLYPKGIEEYASRAPKAGYLYQAMKVDRSVEPAEEYMQDTDGKSGKVHNNVRFGFCAFPAEYGATGTRTFILSENNTIFWKDSGGEPVLEWPSDEELKAEWRKLE